jgi:hypothetical protein
LLKRSEGVSEHGLGITVRDWVRGSGPSRTTAGEPLLAVYKAYCFGTITCLPDLTISQLDRFGQCGRKQAATAYLTTYRSARHAFSTPSKVVLVATVVLDNLHEQMILLALCGWNTVPYVGNHGRSTSDMKVEDFGRLV